MSADVIQGVSSLNIEPQTEPGYRSTCPFTHPDVRRIVTPPYHDLRQVPEAASLHLDGDVLPSRRNLDNSSLKDDRIKVTQGEAGSRPSRVGSTPDKRGGWADVDTPRYWLTGWLQYVDLYCCHITQCEPIAKLVVQFAHILLPNSDRHNEEELVWMEYLLGMAFESLSIHSRLFLMPLKADIHHMLDGDLIFAIPAKATFVRMVDYFNHVFVHRAREERTDRRRSKRNLWRESRGLETKSEENLPLFNDGDVYTYYLVRHPDLHQSTIDSMLNLSHLPKFESHTSPFAVTLNARPKLQKWRENKIVASLKPKLHPTIFELRETEGQTLQKALNALGMVMDIGDDFDNFCNLVDELRRAFDKSKVWKKESGGGGGGGRSGGDAPGDGPEEDHFGGGPMGPLKSGSQKRTSPRDGGNSNPGPSSSVPYSKTALQDKRVITSYSIGVISTWSNDKDTGSLAEEPERHEPSQGRSPAEQIAFDWRERRRREDQADLEESQDCRPTATETETQMESKMESKTLSFPNAYSSWRSVPESLSESPQSATYLCRPSSHVSSTSTLTPSTEIDVITPTASNSSLSLKRAISRLGQVRLAVLSLPLGSMGPKWSTRQIVKASAEDVCERGGAGLVGF